MSQVQDGCKQKRCTTYENDEISDHSVVDARGSIAASHLFPNYEWISFLLLVMLCNLDNSCQVPGSVSANHMSDSNFLYLVFLMDAVSKGFHENMNKT